MDILSLLDASLALYGLLALILLAVAMGLLMRNQRQAQDPTRNRDSRIIFLIMFILVTIFIALTLYGK
jgi:hypothetical protein